DAQKQDFVQLLNCPDPDLFNWLMNKGRPDDEALYQIIRLIQERNQARMAAQNAAYYPD
ncbi:succinate dehydrogenase assembly factor 2, partial [Morganella morganii]